MRKGFALITVLVVLLVIALGAATVLQSVGSFSGMKSNNLMDTKSQYLAEAGMQHALWRCRTSGCIDEPNFIIDGTAVPIDVTFLGGTNFEIKVSVGYADV